MKNILEIAEDTNTVLSTVSIVEKNNIWQAVITFKKYKDGNFIWNKKWKSTGIKAPGNKKQAKDVANNILKEFDKTHREQLIKLFNKEIDTKIGVEGKKQFQHEHLGMNFVEFLRMRLEIVSSAKNYAQGTYDGYDGILENHMKPYFNTDEKQYKVHEINSDVIEAYLVATKKNRRDGKGREEELKNSTLLQHIKLINVAFKQLVDKQIIPNPTSRNR